MLPHGFKFSNREILSIDVALLECRKTSTVHTRVVSGRRPDMKLFREGAQKAYCTYARLKINPSRPSLSEVSWWWETKGKDQPLPPCVRVHMWVGGGGVWQAIPPGLHRCGSTNSDERGAFGVVCGVWGG
jgi:hypothetical protein